jgi:hypothetical protein
MRGSERPIVETETEAKQATGPRDNLHVLVASIVILAIVAAVLFWYFGLLPGGSGLGTGAPK